VLKNFWNKDLIEAGCDEAGRGCLAGPVFAAAVILPQTFKHPLLNDSKQLIDKQRKLLRPIIESEAIAWSVAEVSVEEIDTINILQAALEAMHRAVYQLTTTPEHLHIDGNKFRPFPEIPHTCIIGGDAKMKNIAAASILAKTYRDDRMDELHEEFPQYGWIRNKGYGTADHRAAIKQHGITIHHRKSFRLLPDQLRLF
jgi:ribonuclease HII